MGECRYEWFFQCYLGDYGEGREAEIVGYLNLEAAVDWGGFFECFRGGERLEGLDWVEVEGL